MTGPAVRLVLALAGGLIVPETARAQGPDCGGLEREVLGSLRTRQFLEAHLLAGTAAALCPPSAASARLHTYDALALLELDDSTRARERLARAQALGDPPSRATSQVLLAWSHLRDRDDGAFAAALGRLPPEPQLRLRILAAADDARALPPLLAGLSAEARGRLGHTALRLREAQRTRRPWLAGTLSGLLPGAGQAYAGSWQGAAVAFVLNAVLIGATVELVDRRLYVTAGAAGMAASFFYVGNIINAVDLARRRNEIAAAPPRLELERQVLPEAHP